MSAHAYRAPRATAQMLPASIAQAHVWIRNCEDEDARLKRTLEFTRREITNDWSGKRRAIQNLQGLLLQNSNKLTAYRERLAQLMEATTV